MNKDILLGQYMAIADMVNEGLYVSYDQLEKAILQVRNNNMPF